MKLTVKTEGFAELDKAIGEFSKATGRNIMRRAAMAGGEVIAARAKEIAKGSKDTGELMDSIAVSTKLGGRAKGMSRKASEVEVFVGPSDDVRFRAHFIEFGTAPGKRGGRAGERSTDVKQANGVGRKVYRTHPGNKPQPFMRPAFDEKAEEAIDAVAAALRVEMAKATERARRKALRAKR